VAGPGPVADKVLRDLVHVPNAVLTAVGSRSAERAEAFAAAHAALAGHGRVPTAAREVVAAARASGRFTMEAMWTRFCPAVVRLRELVADRAIGEVCAVTADLGVTARACQGVFAALLAPSALSLLTTTFTDPKERGKAFGIYGAIAASGAALGLLLGGALTSYASWRWCMYINLVFAAIAITGGLLLLGRQPRTPGARLDVPGVAAVSGGMFCLVYGFSNAATHGWHTPSTWGVLAAGAVLLIVFAAWQARAAQPLLPSRVILDRNRGGAYLTMLIFGSGLFGIFLFLIYYMQVNLGYSAVKSGVAMLPMVAVIGVMANVGNIVLMPRFGPKPLICLGLLANAAGMAWLTRIGVHSDYASAVIGPLIVIGFGSGLIFSAAANTGTFGVAPRDAGIASASANTGQQLGGAIGTALLNTIAASAATSYLASHAHGRPTVQLSHLALVHSYTTVFWWCAGIFAVGAVICGALLRRGSLTRTRDMSAREPSQHVAAARS
jgi:MFS family permease